MSDIKIFADRLKNLREDMQMTQSDFSGFLAIKQQTLSGYENNKAKPPLDVAISIAEKCKVSLDWLCGLSDKKNNDEDKKIELYSDVIELILKIMSGNKKGLRARALFESSTMGMTASLYFVDPIMLNFIRDLENMYTLVEKNSIDDDLFELWAKREIEKYRAEIVPLNKARELYSDPPFEIK